PDVSRTDGPGSGLRDRQSPGVGAKGWGRMKDRNRVMADGAGRRRMPLPGITLARGTDCAQRLSASEVFLLDSGQAQEPPSFRADFQAAARIPSIHDLRSV